MERKLFDYILRHSKKEQFYLVLLGVIAQPIYFLSLQLPKTIVDDGIQGKDFPRNYLGVDAEQIPYLLSLCSIYLVLVFINGGFKYFINVYRGAAGERMLRRLRYQLIERIMRFPLPHFRKTSQGEMVSMITQETEPLGGFFGESLSLPVYQGGILLTLMLFMFVQDWILGLAAVALYPVQGYLIPKLQKRVNALGKERVKNVRQLSERIGETVSGSREIHANDTSQYELADYSRRLGRIYAIRFDIYKRKFFIKFLNNFLAQVTPFFFYAIGGVLAIKGEISTGALLAILAAYKDVLAPWKMLLTYYQRLEDARIKFDLLVEKFEPAGMLDARILTEEPKESTPLKGKLVASNLTWEEDDGLKVVDGASMSIDLPRHVALVGSGGKGELAEMLARLLMPSGGRLAVEDQNFAELPETVTGRRMSYVGPNTYLFAGTIRDSLLYGLKHRPLRDAAYEKDALRDKQREQIESERSGNSTMDPAADWIDYAAAGLEGQAALGERMYQVFRQVGLEEDVYQIGLRQTIDPAERPELTQAILEGRRNLLKSLDDPDLARFVESFDKEKYNKNASVAENILFGTPVGEEFTVDRLGENPYVLQVLERVGLGEEFLEIGLRLAETMLDLFRGLPPDHEFFERFGFIGSDDLPEFEAIIRRIGQGGVAKANDDDRARLMALPFKLVQARHHLDLIDDEMEERLLAARREFAANLPADLVSAVEFFDVDEYNDASTIQDNILFGKRASERAESAVKVGALMAEVVERTGLRPDIIELGLDSEVGVGGGRLSGAQRQKLAIARSLIKRPDLLILNEATQSLDAETQEKLLAAVRDEQKERSLIVVPTAGAGHTELDQTFTMESGKIVGHGTAKASSAVEEKPESHEQGVDFGEGIDLLASTPLFAGMDRSRLKLLTFASEQYHYDAGQIVLRQGDVGENAFIIISGDAEVILETVEGPKAVATMGKHEMFGELALLCQAPRTATIAAKTELTAFSITRDTFFKLISEDTDMSARITRFVAERLERTTRDLGEASSLHDSATNLADRRLFTDRLLYTIARGKRFDERSALMCLELAPYLDHVEARMGDGGREVALRTIAARVGDCVRMTDTLARIGAESLAIIVSPIADGFGPERLAQRIADSLAPPITVGGEAVRLGDAFEFRIRDVDEAAPDDQVARCSESVPVTVKVGG